MKKSKRDMAAPRDLGKGTRGRTSVPMDMTLGKAREPGQPHLHLNPSQMESPPSWTHATPGVLILLLMGVVSSVKPSGIDSMRSSMLVTREGSSPPQKGRRAASGP